MSEYCLKRSQSAKRASDVSATTKSNNKYNNTSSCSSSCSSYKVWLQEPTAVDQQIYENYVRIGREGAWQVSADSQKRYEEYVSMKNVMNSDAPSANPKTIETTVDCHDAGTINGCSNQSELTAHSTDSTFTCDNKTPHLAAIEASANHNNKLANAIQEPIWVKRTLSNSTANAKSFSTDV
ncbi:uncharacterized protein LOC142340413 [Convolutriloba macropyga]|uniref:uncharacterized protein LOC142340413 n=1 Tax=Convolutriloba macropyga TaxID=536237 RepID=UPI003F525F3C